MMPLHHRRTDPLRLTAGAPVSVPRQVDRTRPLRPHLPAATLRRRITASGNRRAGDRHQWRRQRLRRHRRFPPVRRTIIGTMLDKVGYFSSKPHIKSLISLTADNQAIF